MVPEGGVSVPWSISGTVRIVSFQGDRFRVELESPSGAKVICSLPSNSDMSRLYIGNTVTLACVNESRVHLIDASVDLVAA